MSNISTGRNDPCPCGSGKKFKKCCLGKEVANASTPSNTEGQNETGVPDLPDESPIRPYMMTRMLENPKVMEEMPKAKIARMKAFWTPAKIAVVGTEEIETQLLRLGIPYSRDALRQINLGHESAWDAAKPWIQTLKEQDRKTMDFVGIAVCELRKRLYPDPPSIEMLDDWMHEGYQFSLRGKPEEACSIWIRFWDVIRLRFTPDLVNVRQVDERLFTGMTQFIGNWVHDFETACHNGGLRSQLCLDIGIRFLRQYLEYFPDDENTRYFRAELPMLLHFSGHFEESETLFNRLIEEHPNNAAGYVDFALALAWQGPQLNRPKDLNRAIALLQRALDIPVVDAEDYEVQSLLEDFRARQGCETEAEDPKPAKD